MLLQGERMVETMLPQGEASHKVKTPWRMDWHEPGVPPRKREYGRARRRAKHKHAEVLPQREHERTMTPQGHMNEAQHEPDWPPRGLLCKGILSTWEGTGPWDLGGGPPRLQNIGLKRLVEAKNDVAGIDTWNKNKRHLATTQLVRQYHHYEKPLRTFPHISLSHPTVEESTHFHFEAH